MSFIRINGQLTQANEKDRLIAFVEQYKAFYNLIDIEAPLEQLEGYRYLFTVDSSYFVNDYYDDGTDVFYSGKKYFNDITGFFYNNKVIQDITISISNRWETFYGKVGQTYYVWVFKQFQYKYLDRRKNISHWIRLTIKSDNHAELKIVDMHKADRPEDDDQDKIINLYDECAFSSQYAQTDLSGCDFKKPVQQPPKPVITTSPNLISSPPITTTPVSKTKTKKIKYRPIPPSSRFSIELTGGGVLPLKNSFTNSELLNYKTNNWQDSGGLAKSYGYTGSISLQFNFTNWLGTGAGYQFFQVPLDHKRLMLQIKNYLGNNGINYDQVTVASDAYSLHLAYASLCFGFGTFKNYKTIFRVEPLIGQVYSDLMFHNNLDIQINYNGGYRQAESISLKTEPFLVMGSKACIQFGIGKYGSVRWQITGYYITGKAEVPGHSFSFNTPNAKIIITPPELELAGLTLGFHFTLNNPRRKKHH